MFMSSNATESIFASGDVLRLDCIVGNLSGETGTMLCCDVADGRWKTTPKLISSKIEHVTWPYDHCSMADI